ncbi:putative inositol polyphosphate multikinase [Operophtera brumata]|uniref:Putative inositol polyphosphate multikinase n=1 Tax=Operophtera brumata TaxID=104452 RepID=A0A0L7LIH0_OPEBR|nr:putative inositol polyphosphate multikinase [Operophtera brumata]
MSDAPDKKKRSARRQRSIYQVHYSIKRKEEMTARPLAKRPGSPEVTAYHQQVAGHTSSEDTKYLGLLQCSNGTILKPIIKEAQRREVALYARLASATEPDLLELRALVPRYGGTTRYGF